MHTWPVEGGKFGASKLLEGGKIGAEKIGDVVQHKVWRMFVGTFLILIYLFWVLLRWNESFHIKSCLHVRYESIQLLVSEFHPIWLRWLLPLRRSSKDWCREPKLSKVNSWYSSALKNRQYCTILPNHVAYTLVCRKIQGVQEEHAIDLSRSRASPLSRDYPRLLAIVHRDMYSRVE